MAFIGNSFTLLKTGNYGPGLKQSFSKNKDVFFIKMSSENTKNKEEAKNEVESMKVPIPGKIKLSESVIIERGKNLKLLSEKWKKRKNCKRRTGTKTFWFYQKFRSIEWENGDVFLDNWALN